MTLCDRASPRAISSITKSPEEATLDKDTGGQIWLMGIKMIAIFRPCFECPVFIEIIFRPLFDYSRRKSQFGNHCGVLDTASVSGRTSANTARGKSGAQAVKHLVLLNLRNPLGAAEVNTDFADLAVTKHTRAEAHPVVPGSSTYRGDGRNLKRGVGFQFFRCLELPIRMPVSVSSAFWPTALSRRRSLAATECPLAPAADGILIPHIGLPGTTG